jgi:hypothetical protein
LLRSGSYIFLLGDGIWAVVRRSTRSNTNNIVSSTRWVGTGTCLTSRSRRYGTIFTYRLFTGCSFEIRIYFFFLNRVLNRWFNASGSWNSLRLKRCFALCNSRRSSWSRLLSASILNFREWILHNRSWLFDTLFLVIIEVIRVVVWSGVSLQLETSFVVRSLFGLS